MTFADEEVLRFEVPMDDMPRKRAVQDSLIHEFRLKEVSVRTVKLMLNGWLC